MLYCQSLQTGPNQLNKYYSWLAVVFIQLVWPDLYICYESMVFSPKATLKHHFGVSKGLNIGTNSGL